MKDYSYFDDNPYPILLDEPAMIRVNAARMPFPTWIQTDDHCLKGSYCLTEEGRSNSQTNLVRTYPVEDEWDALWTEGQPLAEFFEETSND